MDCAYLLANLRVRKCLAEKQCHNPVDYIVGHKVGVAVPVDSPQRRVRGHVRVEDDAAMVSHTKAQHDIL